MLTTTHDDVEAQRALLMMRSASQKRGSLADFMGPDTYPSNCRFRPSPQKDVFLAAHQKQRFWRHQVGRLKISL